MLLSELLKKFNITDNYKILNEKDINTLALASSKVDMKYCTFLESEKYIKGLTNNATMVFVTNDIANKIATKDLGVCIVQDPKITFFKLHNMLQNYDYYRRKEFETRIGENCKIHKYAYIAEKNVIIGNNVVIEEFVSIKPNTVIKDNVTIRAHTVIGGEGFEHKRNLKEIISVKHLGGVVVEKGVELQQNNCVDKAIYPWDNTIIGEATKTDNNVHIAHADKIGKRVFIAACTCIAGRVETGNDVWIGPGVTITNGISIGNNAQISLGSVVTKPVPEGKRVTGNFAIEHSKFMTHIKKLIE